MAVSGSATVCWGATGVVLLWCPGYRPAGVPYGLLAVLGGGLWLLSARCAYLLSLLPPRDDAAEVRAAEEAYEARRRRRLD